LQLTTRSVVARAGHCIRDACRRKKVPSRSGKPYFSLRCLDGTASGAGQPINRPFEVSPDICGQMLSPRRTKLAPLHRKSCKGITIYLFWQVTQGPDGPTLCAVVLMLFESDCGVCGENSQTQEHRGQIRKLLQILGRFVNQLPADQNRVRQLMSKNCDGRKGILQQWFAYRDDVPRIVLEFRICSGGT